MQRGIVGASEAYFSSDLSKNKLEGSVAMASKALVWLPYKTAFPWLVYLTDTLTTSLYEQPTEYCHTGPTNGLFGKHSYKDIFAKYLSGDCDRLPTTNVLVHYTYKWYYLSTQKIPVCYQVHRPRLEMGNTSDSGVHKSRIHVVQFQWKMWKLQLFSGENVQVVVIKAVFIWNVTTCGFGISYQYLGKVRDLKY